MKKVQIVINLLCMFKNKIVFKISIMKFNFKTYSHNF